MKLPPIPKEKFEGESISVDISSFTKCIHSFYQEGWDIRCHSCPNVWPELAKHVKLDQTASNYPIANPHE